LDIEQAIKLGYPSHNVAKLHRRRDKCRIKLVEKGLDKMDLDEAHDTKREWSGQADENCSAYQSTLVSVSSSDSKGRHLMVGAAFPFKFQ